MIEARLSARQAWSPIEGLSHRLGRVGAILALAAQLLLPAIAMPGHDISPAASTLHQALSVWGKDALCTTTRAGEKESSRKAPASHSQCPICWALSQTASLLAPAGASVLLPTLLAQAQHSLTSIASAFQPTYALSQPRAPPLA
jgi:hypothetical protein